MYRIKTYNAIPNIVNQKLSNEIFEIDSNIQNPHGIIVRSHNLFDEDLGNEILAIARAGAGYNTIPVDSCSENGVVIFNTPGANANAVKEMTICALIMSARNVLESIEWTNSLDGDNIPQQAEKGKKSFVGNELKGKTLGILGLGATGALVAQAALDLGMIVLGVDPHLSLSSAWKLNNNVQAVTEDELLQKSDFITIHAPLTEETENKYNAQLIEKTKKGVVLLNFSRAAVANASDIKHALDSGHIKKYVVDFPTKELLNYPGVISMPHLASGTYEAEDNCALMAAEELSDYLINGNIKLSVNYPTCNLGKKVSKVRMCILHKNKPNVIQSITNIISDINIESMISNSKGDYGYMMIDVNFDIDISLITKIDDLEDVIRIRII